MNAIVEYKDPAIEDVKRLANLVLALRDEVFHEGQDFGIIPGTNDKPVLLLPGMEKLLRALNLRPEYMPVSLVEDFDRPLFFYRYECRLVEIDSGRVVSTAIGSANSRESKWRWRNAERVCPHCGKSAIIKGKAEYGGGWLCFAKKGGCGAKFGDNDAAITGQEVGRVENPDIADQMNTIDKIAQKRSLASAIKGAANVSQFFTVDLEDLQAYPMSNGPVVDAVVTVEAPAAVTVEAPAQSNWTKDEAKAWVAARESTGWTRERLKAALGVEYFTDFDGVEDDADMRLTQYKARLDAEDDTRRAAYELAARMEAADPVDAPDPFADDDKPVLGKDEATRLAKWAYKETKMNVSRLCGILNVKNADEFRGSYDDAVAKVEEWRALVNGRQPATLETAVQQA